VTSATVTVPVAQAVSVRASSTHLTHSSHASLRLYGVVSPAMAREKVVLQSYAKRAWRATSITAVTRKQRLPDGRKTIGYVLAVPEHAKGAFRYRVTRAATKTNTAGTSAPVTVTVG
jgi:hypothetical protein